MAFGQGGSGLIFVIARIVVHVCAFRNLPCKPLEPRFACVAAQLAFPHVDHVPPHLPQLFVLPAVAVSVARELRRPELHIRLRHVERFAPLVHVPETAVHKHDRAVLGQHDVGVTRVPLVVFAESEPAREQIGAHGFLDRRVFAADARHGVAARAARVRGLWVRGGLCYATSIARAVDRPRILLHARPCFVHLWLFPGAPRARTHHDG